VQVRLSVAYDTFTPVVTQTYTLWNVTFDHSFSSVGPTPPGNATCGGAEVPVCISIPSPGDVTQESFILTAANTHEDFTFQNPTDQFLTWNSAAGCPGTVPTQPSTWGHLKGLYR
jgi:hypothetical protein